MRFPRIRALVLRTGARGLGGMLRLYARTMRLDRRGLEHLDPVLETGPAIFAFSHNQLLLMPFSLPFRRPYRPIGALISASEDGSLIADAVRMLDVQPVRGSSSRNGDVAREALLAYLRAGGNVCLTPDGPRGPAKVVKPGVVWLALQTGAPIIPLAYAVRRVWRVGSWDRFMIPVPGSKVAFVAGEPIRLDAGLPFAENLVRVQDLLAAHWRSIDPLDPVWDTFSGSKV